MSSPKIGALVRLSPLLGVHANVSRGFRSSDGVISDPTLTPVTAWSYEGGLKFDRSGFASRREGLELDWRAPIVAQRVTIEGNWTFNDARYRSLVAVPEEGGAGSISLRPARGGMCASAGTGSHHTRRSIGPVK